MLTKIPSTNSAFTIVELLVVIVVIGILAAITIVSYTGISSKAIASSLQSDLSSAKKQLALYYIDHGVYPKDIVNNCPIDTVDIADTKYCFKASGSNALTYISSSPYSTFSMSNLNGNTRYSITNNTSTVLGGWIAGITATALANKWIYNVDVGYLQYKTASTAVTSPQGAIGLDSSYPSNMVLINPQTNPNVDLSEYPAQNACKAIGGRLPNMQELWAIYAGRVTYGNFQTGLYLSATEYNSSIEYQVYFYEGSIYYWNSKTVGGNVRCISGR